MRVRRGRIWNGVSELVLKEGGDWAGFLGFVVENEDAWFVGVHV